MTSIIYDIGAHAGDDIPYYLLKADKVIAVEANPRLCDTIKNRFHQDITGGRLIVENCIATAASASGHTEFYVHKNNSLLSQMHQPNDESLPMFNKVTLPSRPVHEIIREHGTPYYIKIDIEHMDAEILEALFAHGIFPDYLSAESHTLDVFGLLASKGRYDAFKLVDGRTVSAFYAQHQIKSIHDYGNITFSFTTDSAGPFGDDIAGDWMSGEFFFRFLAIEGLGWKDIHASRVNTAPLKQMSDQDMLRLCAAKAQGQQILALEAIRSSPKANI